MTTPYRFTPRHIDKPWGYELIWAETEDYVGKVLFVRAGQALSLQYHEQKDESWLVQGGRASLELGEVGGELDDDRDLGRRRLPLSARERCTGSRRSRTRRSSRCRRRISTTSSGSTIATAVPSATPETPKGRSRLHSTRVHHRKRDF